jgi:phosphotransferase system  glucose/maltose/N-acetylglucosamine-specific IIC component
MVAADELIIVGILLFVVVPLIIHWSISLSNLRRIGELESQVKQLQQKLDAEASGE